MNTLYIKYIDGQPSIKERCNIHIVKMISIPGIDKEEEMVIVNPTHETLLEDGWELYEQPEPTFEEVLQEAKDRKIFDILHYDSSEDVNMFYIQGLPVWLDKATRAGLKLRFEAELAIGKTDTILWYNNMQFPLALTDAIQMLYAIEVYASACYDNTQAHVANVNALTSVDEINLYDYTLGYPDKLQF